MAYFIMWTGMGIIRTMLLGMFLFHEKLTVPQVICVILIVVGVAGLKILAKE
ncbi:SMR family transporter, partial [Butyrivibrio sp. AE3004]|uniref:SMR family transporter n=1 Tax=Butyrivibrio sp. AE3004 TaxID=1506994 RepID=UPI0005612006